MLNLTQLNEGDKANVTVLNSEGSIRRRLQDIGIINGTDIQCVQISPLGDPIAYLIRGAVIAIRRCDAKEILIEKI